MALRSKTLTKSPEPEETAPETVSQRRRPEAGQFLLQVDRQTKGSYPTHEAAMEAALAIKQAYPILHVAIFDAQEGQSELIALTPA